MTAAGGIFGNSTRLEAVARDLRLALRSLRRTPGFTFVCTASLATGLTLAIITISVVNAYLLRALPYPDDERLYHVRYAPPGPWEPAGMSGLDWRSVADVVEAPIAASSQPFYFQDQHDTASLRALRVTRGFTEALGVSVIAGRSLDEQDFVGGSERSALIGYAFWRERFGSDPAVVGREIRVEPESASARVETFRVAGVLAPDFYFGNARDRVDLLAPHASALRAYMVKLRPGVPPAAAERRITEAARRAATAPIPPDWAGVHLESARDRAVGGVRPVLTGITVAVGLVLILVSANVAVLLLLRSLQRQTDVAIRIALGAGWLSIARMLLLEVSIIAAVALVVSTGATTFLLDRLAPIIETRLGRPAPNVSGITIDDTVLLAGFAITLLVTVAVSLAPLTSLSRRAAGALWQGRTATDGRPARRVRGGLIAVQVAGSLLLLVSCGLMIRTVVHMLAAGLGFDARGVVTSRIMLRPANYSDPASYRIFHEAFVREGSPALGAPIVFSDWPPYVQRPARVIEGDEGASTSAGSVSVSADYFSTFRIAIRQGRDFTAGEAADRELVAIISDALARALWRDGNALGRRVREVEQTPAGPRAGPWRTVAGVVADVRQTYDDREVADFYKPAIPHGRYGTFYVRPAAALPLVTTETRRIAAVIDRDAILNTPRFVSGDNQSLAGSTFMMWVLTAFSIATTLLAMLGIYGVTAYAAQQRHKEIAIRLALGATSGRILRSFLREGTRLLLLGVAAGLAGTTLLVRLLQSSVVGVRANDPVTLVGATALLAAVSLVTVAAAARRVAFAEPSGALRSQ